MDLRGSNFVLEMEAKYQVQEARPKELCLYEHSIQMGGRRLRYGRQTVYLYERRSLLNLTLWSGHELAGTNRLEISEKAAVCLLPRILQGSK